MFRRLFGFLNCKIIELGLTKESSRANGEHSRGDLSNITAVLETEVRSLDTLALNTMDPNRSCIKEGTTVGIKAESRWVPEENEAGSRSSVFVGLSLSSAISL